jgi:hypothetical protein
VSTNRRPPHIFPLSLRGHQRNDFNEIFPEKIWLTLQRCADGFFAPQLKNLVSRLKSSFKNSAALPHVGRWPLRAAISPQCDRQRPITSVRSPGRHRRACQSESFSSGATRGDYETNGSGQEVLEQIDCGLEDHLPTGVGLYGGVRQ